MKSLRWTALLLILTLLVSIVPRQTEAQTITFTDLDPSYAEEVHYIASLGIIQGYVEKNVNIFKPRNNVTRFQAAKMLIEATEQQNYDGSHIKFTDLASSSESYHYLSKAVALGYFQQNSDGKINPHQSITRAEMGYALALAFNVSEKITAERPLMMSDVRNHPLKEKFNGLYYAGIAQGSNGNFMPDSYLHRAQFAQFLARALDQDRFGVEVKYPDQTSATFLAQVSTEGSLLNIRSTPSTSGEILGKLNHGDIVEVLGVHGDWYHILMNKVSGYIHSDYVEKVEDEIDEDLPPPVVPTFNLVGKVTGAVLNVRSAATTDSEVINQLTLGQKVEVLSLEGNWAKVKLASGTGYVYKTYLKLINQIDAPLKNRIIVVDAGHGAHDPGASSKGVTEKSINLKVAKLVEAKLKKAGAKVHMTRTDDTFYSLAYRTDFAKKHFAETFVSIHVNAAGSTAIKGTEVFYDSSKNDNSTESRTLARYIQNKIVSDANMVSRGVKDADFYVIRNNDIPAVLVELGFLTNNDDFAKLTNDKYLEIYAEAVFQGILQYYSAP